MSSDNDNNITSLRQNDSLLRLSETLNALAAKKTLTVSDTQAARKNLADVAANFNGASAPAVAKIIAALPGIKDHSARWISAKLLRDIALKDKTQAEPALFALIDMQSTEKDAGARYMLSGLIRDIGIADKSLSIAAAAAISNAMRGEKDAYAQSASKHALMSLGMAYEAAAPVAVASLSHALAAEHKPLDRIGWSVDLAHFGTKYASQAAAAIEAIGAAAQKETNGPAATRYGRDIAAIAQRQQKTVLDAIGTLADALRNAPSVETAAGYSFGLKQISDAHPLPVIVALETDLQKFDGKIAGDKRRMTIGTLSGIADMGQTEATAVSKVLQDALIAETEQYNRRMIISGLATCTRNRADGAPVINLLQEQLKTERDRETRELMQKSLRSMGAPAPKSNVYQMQPAVPG